MLEKQRKKKLLIRNIIKIIFIIILIGVAQYYFVKGQPRNKELSTLVFKYNAACPILISNDIRMESVNQLSDNRVQYDFTLVQVIKESINVTDLKKQVEKEIRSIAKKNPSLEAFRDNNSTVSYHYMDKNQQDLFTITLTPDRY
jgi:hypothetical protein